MLTNIINNKTDYENIYEYLIEKIKEIDHSEFLKLNKISLDNKTFISFLNRDLMKFLIMPSSYGMGKHSYRNYVDRIISETDQTGSWQKLQNKEKTLLSDHL